jgi:hypothetical protein
MGRLLEIVLADFFHLIGCIFAIIVGPSVPPHEETIISNSSKRSGASEPLIVTLMYGWQSGRVPLDPAFVDSDPRPKKSDPDLRCHWIGCIFVFTV